jgi:hypothetical protein
MSPCLAQAGVSPHRRLCLWFSLVPPGKCWDITLIKPRPLPCMSRNRSIGVATSCGLDGRGSVPGRGKRFFSSPQRRLWGPTRSPNQWVPRVERPECEAGHSPPSSAENGGAIPPLPHTSSWRGV